MSVTRVASESRAIGPANLTPSMERQKSLSAACSMSKSSRVVVIGPSKRFRSNAPDKSSALVFVLVNSFMTSAPRFNSSGASGSESSWVPNPTQSTSRNSAGHIPSSSIHSKSRVLYGPTVGPTRKTIDTWPSAASYTNFNVIGPISAPPESRRVLGAPANG